MAEPVPGTPDLTPPAGAAPLPDIAAMTQAGQAQYAATPSGNRGSVDIRMRTGTNQFPQPPSGLPPTPQALPEGTKLQEAKPTAPPAQPVQPKENDDLDPSVTGFFKWAWNGAVQGAKSATPALVSGAAESANVFIGMPAAKAADAVIDAVHGRAPGYTTKAQDWMGDYYTKQLKPAIDAWEPEAGNPIAAGAQGGTMLALTKLPYVGQVAGAAMASGAFTRSLTNSLDEGQSATQAVSGATVDALATLAIMKFVGKEGVGLDSVPYAWLRRAIAAVPIADAIGLGQDLAKKAILEVTGNHAAAQKIDPTEKLTDVGNIIQNEIFAIVGGVHHGDQGGHQGGPTPPPPEPVKGAPSSTPPAPEGHEPPPPPPPPAAIKPESNFTKQELAAQAEQRAIHGETLSQPGQPVPPVPDHPTGEPARQIRAQLVDMNRGDTPRQAVLITPETTAHLDQLGEKHAQAGPVKNQIEQARAQGRVVETPVGDLVVKTKALAAGARADLNAGKDPQEVIGRLTIGADGPKRPDQTQIVQALEPHDGAVTSERAVSPAERDPVMQEAFDSGKVPRVVVPEKVLVDRQEGMAKELPTPGPGMTQPEIAAPAASPEPAKGEPGFMKTASGHEVPVHVLPDGTVQQLDIHGEPTGTPVKPLEGSVRTGPVAKAEQSNEPPVPETKPGQSALEQLPAVLATHERAEAVPEGKKKAASLKERQDNVSAVAEALQRAAVEAAEKGTAPPAAIERANAAAKAAKDLTNKSKEDTEKGRGTSHALITARTKEIHKAARELLGTAKPGDEVRETVKKAVRAVTKEVVKGGAEAVNKKREERKPASPEKPQATRQEYARMEALKDKYMGARTPDTARAAREELEAHLNSVVDRLGQSREMVMEFLKGADEDRREQGGRKMSDTLEGETTEFDRPEEGFETVYRPTPDDDRLERNRRALGPKRIFSWAPTTVKELHDLATTGERIKDIFDRIHEARDRGVGISQHRLLQLIAGHAEGTLKQHIEALLKVVPDVPVYARSDITNPQTGELLNVMGLYHSGFAGTMDNPRAIGGVQMKFDTHGKYGAGDIVYALMHEAEHSATEHELQRNPNGELGSQLNHALEVLRRRMAARFGQDVVDDHLAYWNVRDAGPPRGGVMRDLYGISNPSELLAEIRSNPTFRQLVIQSEAHASPADHIPPAQGMPGLLHYIVKAVSRFLFRNTPFADREPELIRHILDVQRNIEAAQRANPLFANLYGEGAFERLYAGQPKSFQRNLSTVARPENDWFKAAPGGIFSRPSPMLKAEDGARTMVGDEGVKTSRDTAHAIASGGVDKVRRAVTALKTVGQIFRSQTRYFGHEDDPNNPLNEYRDAMTDKERAIMEGKRITNPIAKMWQKLSPESNRRVGQLMIDTGLYKIDPRKMLTAEELAAKSPQYQRQYEEFHRRYDALTDEERAVYKGAAEANKQMRAIERRTAIDSAIEGFDLKVTDGERALLYGADKPGDFERLIGPGKLLDFGEHNDKMANALKDWAGGRDLEGPYFHMGRQGNYVVQAKPEGTKEFGSKEEAERWADSARGMGPTAKADVEERGGKWVVDYKVDHVSMHKTRKEAEKMRDQLTRGGFEPGSVTEKNFDASNAPLSHGMTELMAEATRKLNRGGNPEDVKPLVDSLHSAFLQMQAQRSAYAGSRLMRKGVGGVKASEMRQNFAEHATATMWHNAQLRTIFKQAAALARLRGMARDSDAPQDVAYQRGETVSALANHAALDVQNYGKFGGYNRATARLGFLSYLASPAHAAIWMTQNAYGIATAGAKYGYGRSTAAFGRGMGAVFSPGMRATMRAAFKGGTADDITAAMIKAISEHPTMGKWGPAIKELHDRGVIQHGYANELGDLAAGGGNRATRAFEWARLLPSMADAFNRTSTALAGLELTGGDLRKTTDLIEQIHADYSQANKPLAFKYASRVPGGNSLIMMKTYVQSMAHLFYSNLGATITGETRQAKWEAAKTVAGMMVASTLFSGVYGAIGLEPVRLIAYAYHKLFDEEGEVWDMKNAVHHWLVDTLGAGVGNALARGPIASALGVDVQDRMGLANLFFFNPPDLMTTDKTVWSTFLMDELGPLFQMVVDGVSGATGHIQNGEYAQAIASLVPIKVVKDGLKALQLASTGKTNIRGAVQTEPSVGDAAKQLFGLKPENVANAQEKAGVMSEYSKAQAVARTNIIRALAGGKDGAVERMQSFNERFPNRKITSAEVRAYMKGTMKQEQGITKDRAAAAAADFSGR